MPMQIREETTYQRLLRRYGSRDLWSIRLILVSAPIYALASYAFDAIRVDNYSLTWVGIAIITYFELIVLGLMARYLTPKSWWKTRASALVNLTYVMVIGAVKNTSVAALALNLNLETKIDWFMRAFGGATMAVSISIFFVLLAGSWLEHQETMKNLMAKRRELLGLQDNAAFIVASEQQDLIDETRRVIEPKLMQIQTFLATGISAENIIEQMRLLLNESIRPLSRALQIQASGFQLTPTQSSEVPETRLRLPDKFTIFTCIFPVPTWAIVTATMTWVHYMLFPDQPILLALLSSLPSLAILAIAKLMSKPVGAVRAMSAILAFAGLSIAITVTSVFALQILQGLGGFAVVFSLSHLITSTVVTFAFAYVSLINRDRRDLEASTRLATEQLEIELKVFEQALWLNRKSWGYLLHGTVQARLTAAIARLGAISELNSQAVDEVEASIRTIRNSLAAPRPISIDLASELANLKASWRGVCDVVIEVEKGIPRALKENHELAFCVNELCKEAISNAFRHGAAKNATIKIALVDTQLFQLTIVNDGRSVRATSSSQSRHTEGLGLKLYDELCLSWSLKSDGISKKTTLNLLVPVQPNTTDSNPRLSKKAK
jgi:hypothetical protein